MTTPTIAWKFRGSMNTRLSSDWRVPLTRSWAALFGARPIIITLNDDAPGWQLHPEPPDWMSYLHDRTTPMQPWFLTQVGSRSRVVIPAAMRYEAPDIEHRAHVSIVGQGSHLEIWPTHAWEKQQQIVLRDAAKEQGQVLQ